MLWLASTEADGIIKFCYSAQSWVGGEIAAEMNIRSTELIRRFVYAALERDLPSSVYNEAAAADEAVAAAVRNRVKGRTKTKMLLLRPILW